MTAKAADPTASPDVVLRAARPDDIPALAEMIEQANLPPMFIEEFLDGFIVGERAGEIVSCGGLEMYGTSAVIRSVVVSPTARGTGLGGRIARGLLDRARAAGATDAYLFTMDAWEFWKHLGFVDVAFEEWREEPRECWQYVVVSQNRELEMFAPVHTMWRSLRQWHASPSG
jgi:amino-acid N-acetyltransferase